MYFWQRNLYNFTCRVTIFNHTYTVIMYTVILCYLMWWSLTNMKATFLSICRTVSVYTQDVFENWKKQGHSTNLQDFKIIEKIEHNFYLCINTDIFIRLYTNIFLVIISVLPFIDYIFSTHTLLTDSQVQLLGRNCLFLQLTTLLKENGFSPFVFM